MRSDHVHNSFRGSGNEIFVGRFDYNGHLRHGVDASVRKRKDAAIGLAQIGVHGTFAPVPGTIKPGNRLIHRLGCPRAFRLNTGLHALFNQDGVYRVNNFFYKSGVRFTLLVPYGGNVILIGAEGLPVIQVLPESFIV